MTCSGTGRCWWDRTIRGTGPDTLLTIKTTNPNSLPFSARTNRWAPAAPRRVRFDAHADAPAGFTIRYLALQF